MDRPLYSWDLFDGSGNAIRPRSDWNNDWDHYRVRWVVIAPAGRPNMQLRHAYGPLGCSMSLLPGAVVPIISEERPYNIRTALFAAYHAET